MAETFGATIRRLRKEHQLTQRELASRIDVDVGYISKIESNKVPPPSEQVITRLADALTVEVDILMTLAGKASRDLAPIISRDQRIPTILRRTRGLTADDWDKVAALIDQLTAERRNQDLH